MDRRIDWRLLAAAALFAVALAARAQAPGVSATQAQAALAAPFAEWARAADPKRRPEDVPTLVVREGGGGLDSRHEFGLEHV